MTRFEKFVVPVMFICVIGVSVAMSQTGGPSAEQDAPQAAQQERGRRMRGNFDPAVMHQRVLDRIKEQLNASDEEWTVIQPKLDRVLTAQRAARSGMGMGWRGNRGGDNAQRPAPTGAVEIASSELRTALDDPETAPADVAAKLAALRAARAKAQAELDAAREDFKQVLTARQEATMVMMNVIE